MKKNKLFYALCAMSFVALTVTNLTTAQPVKTDKSKAPTTGGSEQSKNSSQQTSNTQKSDSEKAKSLVGHSIKPPKGYL